MTTDAYQPAQPDRRGFIKVLAAVLGGLVGLVPFGAGLVTFLDPLRRKSGIGGFVRLTSLDALADDGKPRKFTVVASKTDAWNKFPETPIGAVYVRRTGEKAVEALSVVCPHAGCFVDYLPSQGSYLCPCHNSSFGLDGSIKDLHSPSPRGLDTLATEVRNGNEIWVKFQNFVAGHQEKIPLA